ncbi:unnamed protein product [Caenorhabditis brenneri]
MQRYPHHISPLYVDNGTNLKDTVAAQDGEMKLEPIKINLGSLKKVISEDTADLKKFISDFNHADLKTVYVDNGKNQFGLFEMCYSRKNEEIQIVRKAQNENCGREGIRSFGAVDRSPAQNPQQLPNLKIGFTDFNSHKVVLKMFIAAGLLICLHLFLYHLYWLPDNINRLLPIVIYSTWLFGALFETVRHRVRARILNSATKENKKKLKEIIGRKFRLDADAFDVYNRSRRSRSEERQKKDDSSKHQKIHYSVDLVRGTERHEDLFSSVNPAKFCYHPATIAVRKLQMREEFMKFRPNPQNVNSAPISYESREYRQIFNRQIRQFTTGDHEYEGPKSEDEVMNITYVLRDDKERKIRGNVGTTLRWRVHVSVYPEVLHLYASTYDPAFKDKLLIAKKEVKAKKIAEKMEVAAGYGSTSSGGPSTSEALGTSGFNRVGKNIDLKKKLDFSKPTSEMQPSTSNQTQRKRAKKQAFRKTGDRIVIKWSEEKELELEIKKLAAKGHNDAARQLAKQLVQLKNHKTKSIGTSARVSGVQTQNAHMNGIAKMDSAMGTTVKTMKEMNRQMPLEKVAANMREFQMQQEKMGLTEQMMNDTLDSILDAPEDILRSRTPYGTANFFVYKM